MRKHFSTALAFALLAASSFTAGCTAEDASPDANGAVPANVDNAAPAAPATNDAPKSPLSMPAYLKNPATSTFMNGIEMGTPFDSIIDAPNIGANSAIAPGFALTEVLGQIQASATIRRIETTEDLYSALEITASLDVQGKSWGVSASTTFARDRRLKAESLYILVEARATGRTEKVTNAQLAPEAKNLSADEFYKRYGDRYASAVVMGQQIFGVIEIHTSSIEEKEQIAATLGVSYGPATFNTSIKSTLDSVQTSFQETVEGDALGTTPPSTLSVDDFIASVDQKMKDFSASKADMGSQAFEIRYTSYYGLDGYPGVPAGVEPKVAEHARAASDFLLYRSLVSDFTSRGYDVSDPVLAGMKKYGDDLQTYLTASIQTTPELPTLPAVAPNSAIESFAQIDAASWQGKPFVVHSYKNGFLPKKLSDYEIPLRYTRDNVRNGVTYSPITVNHQVLAYATETAQDMQLWAVKRQGATGEIECLAYRWTNGPSYFLGNVTANGKLDANAIEADLYRDDFTNLSDSSTSGKSFVFVNEGSGLVVSIVANVGLKQASLTTTANTDGTLVQWWGTEQWYFSFSGMQMLPNGLRWIRQTGTPSTVWDVANESSAAYTPVMNWGANGGYNQEFTFQDVGGGYRTISTNTGGGVVSVSPECQTPGCQNPWLAEGQPIVQLPLVDPMTGKPGANQRWRIISAEHIEEIH